MTSSSELDFIMKNIKFHVHLWKRNATLRGKIHNATLQEHSNPSI